MSVYSDSNRGIEPATQLLRDLRDAGIFTIVVDTSEHSQTPESTPGDLYVHRRNEGWDFASWFSILMRWPEITARADRLLLTNDSNYGPLRPLPGILTEGRALGANVWGITDSWAIDYHLQSYFLEFDTTTLRSGVLQEFIADFPFAVVKDEVVRNGEIALTKFLMNHGFSLRPLIPYERITDRLLANFKQMVDSILELPENQLQLNLGRSQDIYELAFLLDVVDSIRMSVPLDPTLHLWDTLIQLGGPFIKRKLVLSREGGFP
ncbi:MAG: rhamnan synthesis F family protein, partial [Actinomycetota bacterium]